MLHLASPAVCLVGVAGGEQVEGVEKCLVVLAVGKGMVKSCVRYSSLRQPKLSYSSSFKISTFNYLFGSCNMELYSYTNSGCSLHQHIQKPIKKQYHYELLTNLLFLYVYMFIHLCMYMYNLL